MIARPTIVYSVVACLLLILLSSCGAAAATPTPPAPTPVLEGNAGGNVTLLLWHGWSNADSQTLGRLVERFNRQHPTGQITLQQVPLATFGSELRAAVARGSGPHLILMPNSWTGSLADVLLPLDDQIAPAEQETLLPVTISGAQAHDSDGAMHLYGLPVSFDTLVLYYNNANVLTAPADTTQLIESAYALGAPTAAEPRWGLALNLSLDNTIGYLYAYGGRIFDDDGRLVLGTSGRDGAEQWLSWMLKLHTDQQLLTRADSSIQVDRAIKNNRVLMTFDWAHQIAVYRNLWHEHLSIAPLPRLGETNQPPQPYVKSDVLAINRRIGTTELRAAAEFLRFMVSQEGQLELLTHDIQPARGDLSLDGDDPQLTAARAFRSQAEQGRPMLNSPLRAAIEQELKLMQRQVLMGFVTPADAVAEADRRLRERLNLP